VSSPVRVAILGATGSIGRQALEVVAAHPRRLRVTAVAARSSESELRALADDCGAAACLEERDGADAVCELATRADVDLVLVATPGIAGLAPTLAALEAGKDVALANKEVLVVGGHLVRAAAGGAGKRLRPVDSEHHALWLCLRGERPEHVRRVGLTASGGPFRDLPLARLTTVTPEDALRHPTWRMGPKVTVDSATLANKGYEVVEAHWLYDLRYDQIEVVLHPESLIHALVELTDGSVKAELAEPDMRLPIQYALLWDHAPCPARRLDWGRERVLRFEPLERERYPCLELVLATARSGDLGAMVGLSAADEIAVERFLRGEISFMRIPELLARGAELGAAGRQAPDLATIRAIDADVRARLLVERAPAGSAA
jgi:1-deoxy-D-xylulose-5-phosphate reductoisomerase